MLKTENVDISDTDFKRMIVDVDKDRDGSVDYEEFMEMLKKSKHLGG